MTAPRRFSPALFVSVLALVVACSGASYAVGLARNSVGTPQLKNGAVTSAKVKDGSLKRADLSPAALGAKGWVRVSAAGTLVEQSGPAATVLRTQTGKYCLSGPFASAGKAFVATADTFSGVYLTVHSVGPQPHCDGNVLEIAAWSGSGTATDVDFTIAVL